MKKNLKKLNKLQKALLITLAVLVTLTVISLVYLCDHYACNEAAINEFANTVSVEMREVEKCIFACGGDNSQIGFIFYPGGKVDHRAYEPLLLACADKGILCVLIKMPFNMAFFDANAADRVFENFPNVEKWYIGGHSLGGSIACSYAAKNAGRLDGVVLLGSYSIDDLTASGLEVLTVMGSEDKIIGEDHEKFRHMLPEATHEEEIAGGCHAGFGMYGVQKGDGTPSITNTEQIQKTAQIIADFIGK